MYWLFICLMTANLPMRYKINDLKGINFYLYFCDCMNNNFDYQENKYQFRRYPSTENRSLKAWNAADEYILSSIEDLKIEPRSIIIYNDRFGFLTSCLHAYLPLVMVNYQSQDKAIQKNLEDNQLDTNSLEFLTPLIALDKKIKTGIIKIPKSLDLFRLQLAQLSEQLEEDGIILGAFMTKYFSPQIISIAQEFFEEVEQSKAWKKSRVIILQKKKTLKKIVPIHTLTFQSINFQQYFGVFSAKNIDYASQFFIEHLKTKEEKRVLDLACGNGVLGKMIQLQNPNCEIHLIDDSFLAVESAKLNLENKNTFFHYNDSLEIFKDDFFDLVISNPPFHFEYETNIEVAIRLFQGVKRCLINGGRFQLVASRHLNFKTHLEKIFSSVNITSENQKFVIYECFK